MKTSLDTNVLIHLYLAGEQGMLFQRFTDGLYMYEQIREVELENHGSAILSEIDKDIARGQIEKITDNWLKEKGVLSVFRQHVNCNKNLYGPGDMGEVYAISLAETLGINFLVTDDTKQGGPYMSLMQFAGSEIIPFTYTDVLLLNYLEGAVDAAAAVELFLKVNRAAGMNWDFRSQMKKFIMRFWKEPYKEDEKVWMKEFCADHGVEAKRKLAELAKIL